MSDAGGSGGGGGVALAEIDATLAVFSDSWVEPFLAALDGANTVADIIGELDRFPSLVEDQVKAGLLTPAVANSVDLVASGISRATELGILAPDQVAPFIAWLPHHSGQLAAVPGTPLNQGVIAVAVGYSAANPHPKQPPPPPAPHKGPTPAQRAVTTAAKGIHARHIQAPGLTPQETAAVSKAIGVAFADMLRAQAAVLDSYFGPITPGELPRALTDLFRADRILSHQVARLTTEVGGKAPAHVGGQLHGLQETVHGMGQAVEHLVEQFQERQPSTLHTHVVNNTHEITGVVDRLNHIGEEVIPTLEAGALVVGKNLTNLNELVGGIPTGRVQHDLNTLTQEVRSKVEPSIQTLEDCCAANSAVTKPIHEGGATPSLLGKLGGLLKRAFEIGFAATVVETLLAVLDMPAVASGVAGDVETVSTWAVSAAGPVTGDLSWLGRLNV